MTRNHRDLTIADLAASEAEFIDQIVELTASRDAFRELAQQAIHTLQDLTVKRDQLRVQHQELIAEYRALREQTTRQMVAM